MLIATDQPKAQMPTPGIMLRASTTHASGREANSRRCCESGGGRICRVAAERVVSAGFGIAKLMTGRCPRNNPVRSAQQDFAVIEKQQTTPGRLKRHLR